MEAKDCGFTSCGGVQAKGIVTCFVPLVYAVKALQKES